MATSLCQAQVLYGSIVGNVKDSTGAAVPEAGVAIKETATGFSRQTRTNESGQFQFPTVPGGVYEVTVSKPGFTTFSTREVNVSPNSIARVDGTLEVGAVTESIRIEAAPAALQTDRSEVRTELSSRQFANAPLPPGRNYSHMFKVLPGFTYPRNGNGPSVDPSRAALYNVNGTSRQSNAVRLEGAGVNQIWLPHLPGYTLAIPPLSRPSTMSISPPIPSTPKPDSPAAPRSTYRSRAAPTSFTARRSGTTTATPPRPSPSFFQRGKESPRRSSIRTAPPPAGPSSGTSSSSSAAMKAPTTGSTHRVLTPFQRLRFDAAT
jgi:hypothetical protein